MYYCANSLCVQRASTARVHPFMNSCNLPPPMRKKQGVNPVAQNRNHISKPHLRSVGGEHRINIFQNSKQRFLLILLPLFPLFSKPDAFCLIACQQAFVGRDYSTFDNKRNHSPLMKKRPESRHPVGGRRSSELSRDQRGGPSLGREPPSMPTVSFQS
jgi:hypothetical protein